MARFHGKLGFAESVETSPGIWEEVIHEHEGRGDILTISRSLQGSDKVNSDINISNRISVVMNEYIRNHFFNLRYVTWQNVKWKANSVDVEHPRLIITLGGLYNESV